MSKLSNKYINTTLFDKFCAKHGIDHNFSTPHTPQQNGVVECKNRVLEELGRTRINKNCLPKLGRCHLHDMLCF